jgi:uncharacterized protein with LGFP repeats
VPGGVQANYALGIVVQAYGAAPHTVTGSIQATYEATGGPAGPLGAPTTDAFGPLRGGGFGQHFQFGSIYWSPTTGAHTLTGAIRDEYAATGWETNLGYPTTDAIGPLKGGGWGQHFQNGSIYWSPTSGARIVRAQFRDAWARQGWEHGRLGYPTSEVYAVRGGQAQRFQHGTITWTQKGNRTAVAYRR